MCNRYKGYEEAQNFVNKLLFSIDGTAFPINEPTPFSQHWWSHKCNGPAIRYEIGLSLRTSDIVWGHGGVQPGLFNDLVLARSCVVDMFDEGESIVADAIYNDHLFFAKGRRGIVSPRDTLIKKILARIRSIKDAPKQS